MELLEFQGQRRWDGQKVVPWRPEPIETGNIDRLVGGPDFKELATHTQRMHTAIASVVQNWAGLENSVARLLDVMIQPSGIGMALYYSPNATETRFDLTDTAVQHLSLRHHPGSVLLDIWTKILAKMGKAKASRNKIIHGNVAMIFKNGRNHLRLIPPIFDIGHQNREFIKAGSSKRPQHNPMLTQLPGMSVHDVEAVVSNISELSAFCHRLRWPIILMQTCPDKPEASLEKLRELEADLTKPHARPKGDQTPQEL